MRTWTRRAFNNELPFCLFVRQVKLDTAEHRAFAVETCIKSNDSIVAIQRILRRGFNLGRHRNCLLYTSTCFGKFCF